jgi:hypothetical protein
MDATQRKVLLLTLTIGVFATIAILNLSMRSGRLAIPLKYDDIAYISDGFDRYLAFVGGDTGRFLAAFAHDHAPFQVLLAMLGFLVFGVRTWAPYAMNGGLLLMSIAAIVWMTRGLGFWTQLALVLLVTLAPLFGNLVEEFHPDLFWGLLCGFACYLLLQPASLQPPARNQITIVIISAIAVHWKPSAVLPSLALIGGASLLSLAAALLERGADDPARPILYRYFRSALGLTLILIPFFAVNAAALVDYMQQFLSQVDVYRTGETSWQTLNAYLFGDFYGFGLSRLLYTGLGVAVLNLAIRPQPTTSLRRRYRLFLLVVIWSFLIPTLSPIKTFFLGASFFGCFICFTIAGIHDLAIWAQRSFPKLASWLVPIVVSACALLLVGPPPFVMTTAPAEAAELNQIADAIAGPLVDDAKKAGTATRCVFVVSPTPLTGAYFVFQARLAGLTMTSAEAYYVDSLSDGESLADHCDYLFLSESRTTSNYPGDRLVDPMIAWARANPSYSILVDFVDSRARHNLLFRRGAP